MKELEALGASVCGVSVDPPARLSRFARKYNLPFTLLSDPRGATAARYGSLVNLVLLKLARRNTFLIDPQGRVARRYLGVSPARNAAEVIADLRKLADKR
jgi:thioredoxin-dependent peroxiredoxin